jgi:hypothetical protein
LSLTQYKAKGTAVLFLICRVGGDNTAEKSLSKLKENDSIRNMVLYSEDRLDDKLVSLQNNLNEYTGYVSTPENTLSLGTRRMLVRSSAPRH